MTPQITLFPLLFCLVKGSVIPTGYSLPNEDDGGSYFPQSSSTSQLYTSYYTSQGYSPLTSSSSCNCHHTITSTLSTSSGAPLIATCLTPSGSSPSPCTLQPTTTYSSTSISTESSSPPPMSFSTSTSTQTDIVTPTSYVTVTSIITSTNSIPTTSAESTGHGYGTDPTPWSTDSTTSNTPTSSGISESSSTESSSTGTTQSPSLTTSQADGNGGGDKPTAGISVMFENYLDITLYNDTECKTVQWSGSKAIWWMFGFYSGYFQKVFDVVRHEPGDGEQKEQWGKATETVRCTASVTASPTEVYSMTVDRTSQPTSTDGPAFFSCTSLSAAQATQLYNLREEGLNEQPGIMGVNVPIPG
ncbi:uncharacterized protein L199_007782 [Kwoniella botswanensis]|uniref:uncharacterized protein n=1 Tax=Kwoniella botswanensis TaxID=1268659 RepID=UPI00315D910F